MKLLPIGGRVKSSSIPYNSLEPDLKNQDFQNTVRDIVLGKNPEANLCFFPSTGQALKTRLARQPLRGAISTHQGMPGNFFPFHFSETVTSLLNCDYNMSGDHYEAVTEPRFRQYIGKTEENDFISYMREKNLRSAFGVLQGINTQHAKRAKGKGLFPFFICRPGQTSQTLKIPENLNENISEKTNELLSHIIQCAAQLEQNAKNGTKVDMSQIFHFVLDGNNKLPCIPKYLEDSISYLQADVMLGKDGDTNIESIHLPDVGFFLKQLSSHGSLDEVQNINAKLRQKVIEKILESPYENICFVTRPEVIEDNEDLLEIKELEVFKESLGKDKNISCTSTKNINFSHDTLYVLMNIDYNDILSQKLFELAIKYPENFSPNPFVQYASQHITGFNSIILTQKEDIIKLAQITQPNERKLNNPVFGQLARQRIEDYFSTLGFRQENRIIYIKSIESGKTLYVSRDSLHTLRKIAHFVSGEKMIELSEVPFRDGNHIISKNGYNLLHMFRCMFIK